MSRRSKPTKYERVRIDFTIEFKDEHDSTIFGSKEDFGLLTEAIFKAIDSVSGARGVVAMLGGTSIQFGLDKRKRDAEGKVLR